MPRTSPQPTPAYRNPALTIEERVADLLARMTLEEKVGQLMLWDARPDDLSFINTRQPGSVLHILGEKVGRAMDLAALNRLGIPLLVGEDGIHGHSFLKGATIFPTQLALAASWNPGLLEQVGRVTAEEMTATGIHWTFSPVLCLSRDLRWGRTGETFGEDPYLISELGAALIRCRARHRQAFCRLLRNTRRKGFVRGGPLAPQAAQLFPAPLRARRPRRGDDLHDRLPIDRGLAFDL
jgi:beta-glucosidase